MIGTSLHVGQESDGRQKDAGRKRVGERESALCAVLDKFSTTSEDSFPG